jgi:predicted nucleic acid-binding protein
MKTALDSNILSSLWSAEATAPHVKQQLVAARAQGSIVICAPVYIELGAHPLVSHGLVDRLLAEAGIDVEFDFEEAVWRKAAERFAAYAQRRRTSGGGSAKRLLADFWIAAHALVSADQFLTLEASRYRQDFPELRLS